jgi:hypothetical protein
MGRRRILTFDSWRLLIVGDFCEEVRLLRGGETVARSCDFYKEQ